MEQLHFWGRCQANPKGPVWRDLRDSLAELLTHHLQQVSLATGSDDSTEDSEMFSALVSLRLLLWQLT